jgi:hypothetical protein
LYLKMTAEDYCDKVTDKSLLNYKKSSAIHIDQQHFYLCDECGFEPCICVYILEIDAKTHYHIVDDQGEL